MSNYFSDRELGPRARTEQTIGPVAWAGIAVLVEALASSGAFGASFLQECPDGNAICGNDTDSLKVAIEAEIEGLSWPLQRDEVDEDDFMRTRKPWAPPTLVALDFMEFAWRTVAVLIHRWLLGTHQGAVQPAQLDHYLDEFVFRFNRRTSLSRGMLFYRLLEQAVVTTPVTYQHVVNRSNTQKMTLRS